MMSRYLRIFGLSSISILFFFEIALASIDANNRAAGATTNYTYSFNASVDSLASFTISFPGAFNVQGVLIAASTTMDGGFDVSAPSGNQFTITRDGAGTDTPSGNQDLIFGVVTNPTTAGNYSITITGAVSESPTINITSAAL
ncbi:MAG TPA: hypothetical protein VGA99_11265, partial [bacterium]